MPNDGPTIACPGPELRSGAQGLARVAVDDQAARLVVTFLRPIVLPAETYVLSPRAYVLTGGARLFPRILSASLYNPSGTPPDLLDHRVLIQLDSLGDFSIYTLSIVGSDVDPFFASQPLRFRLACDDPFDCRPPVSPAAPSLETSVVVDYLAKDYASFRQALLDFLPVRHPEWTERSEADIGIMLLELFAASADNLSYLQDRIANEAFLGTASQRRSVAGHLALLDYRLDEGASAFAWLQFQVNSIATVPTSPGIRVSNRPLRVDEPLVVYETNGSPTLYPEHNQLAIYDWGNQDCCLPRAATSLALVGSYEHLAAGDHLLLDDGRGQRDVIRLISPPEIVPADPIKARPDGPITIVRWSVATPLHADYCVGRTIARGNLVLATHGETVTESLRDLSPAQIAAVDAEVAARKPWQRVPRERLDLARAPLAHVDASTLALIAPLGQPAPETGLAPVNPSVSTLSIEVNGKPWQEVPSLLDSGPDDPVFRVEIDDAGDATVVFGDGTFGRRPDETSTVVATYRIGGGRAGNLGADTLVLARPRAAESFPWLVAVTNPLPAVGGRDLETRDHARRFAPATIGQPLVAVTAADYENAAHDFVDANGQQLIQRARADFRWTGSWLTVTLAVDPAGGEALTADLESSLAAYLETRRLAGYDLQITPALYVPIDLAIEFCTRPVFRAGDLEQALLRALSNGALPNGGKGFFHPDNFSFGDDIYVSRLYAAIMAVPGVESATITRLARLWAAHPDAETAANLRQGYLEVGASEIVRLDNDRNFPQNGVLAIRPRGGT